jgi:hypothetical protein
MSVDSDFRTTVMAFFGFAVCWPAADERGLKAGARGYQQPWLKETAPDSPNPHRFRARQSKTKG